MSAQTISVVLTAATEQFNREVTAAGTRFKSVMDSMAADAKQSAAQVQSAQGKLFQQLDIRPIAAIKAEMAGLGAAYRQIATSGSLSTADLERAHSALQTRLIALRAELQTGQVSGWRGVAQAGQSVIDVMGRVSPAIAVVIAAMAAIAVPAAKLEDIQTRLKGLTKSGDDYQEVWRRVVKLAQEQHQSLDTVAESESKLLNLERSGLITRQQNLALLEGFGNVAAKTGASSDQLGQSMFGLAQAMSSGTVRAEEFNQITEPLPGLMAELDKAARLPAGGFRQLVNDGKVTSDFLADTLVKALGAYEGASAKTSGNISAHWRDLQTTMQLALSHHQGIINKVVNGTLGVAEGGVVLLDKFITQFENEFERLDQIAGTKNMEEKLRKALKQPPIEEIRAHQERVKQAFAEQAAATAAAQTDAAKKSANAWESSSLDIGKAVAKIAQSVKTQTDQIGAAEKSALTGVSDYFDHRNLRIQQAHMNESAREKAMTTSLIAEYSERTRMAQKYGDDKVAAVDTAFGKEQKAASNNKTAQEAIEREALSAKRVIWGEMAGAYREAINKLISEDERHLAEIRRIELERSGLQMDTEGTIRSIRRSMMTEESSRADEAREADQRLSEARQALAKGDYDAAMKYAKAADSLAIDAARSAAGAAKAGKASNTEVEGFIGKVKDGRKLMDDILAAQQKSETEQHQQLQAAIKTTEENLTAIKGKIEEVDKALAAPKVLQVQLDQASWKTVQDAVTNFVNTPAVKKVVIQMSGDGTAQSTSSYAMGGTVGRFADGGMPRKPAPGMIDGPGSGTSDDILFRASAGEHLFVTKESRARTVFPLLNFLNFGTDEQVSRALSALRNAQRVPRFADGGSLSSLAANALAGFAGNFASDNRAGSEKGYYKIDLSFNGAQETATLPATSNAAALIGELKKAGFAWAGR